jgi:glycosyltransferase involved in cell wall biosynthesis
MVNKDLNNLRPGLVSVGLPVYNGADYLREALDSLLAQDYLDFELIISDNCSTDETEVICREYEARDARVRYSRTERNIGPVLNWARVYELARGEFFMWAAHDDRRERRCLSLCVAALEGNARALMCCMDARLIDEEGRDVSDLYSFRRHHPTGATPHERLRRHVRASYWLDIYSLFRTRAIAQTRLGTMNVWAGDVVLVAEVCLRGEVEEVREKLLDYRHFRAKTQEEMAENQSLPGDTVLVSWSGLVADLMECVRLAPLGLTEKLRLKWMVAVEMCLRNPVLSSGVSGEDFGVARRAFADGSYRRALTLASVILLGRTAGLAGHVKNSIRYRGGRLMRVLLPDRARRLQ